MMKACLLASVMCAFALSASDDSWDEASSPTISKQTHLKPTPLKDYLEMSSPLVALDASLPDGKTKLAFDGKRFAEIESKINAGHKHLRLVDTGIPGAMELEVTPYKVFTEDAVLETEDGELELPRMVSVHGKVAGDEDSFVTLHIAKHGAYGTVQSNQRTWQIGTHDQSAHSVLMEITADRGETVSDLESLDSTITPPPRWTPDSDNAKLTQTAVRATTDNFDATGNSPVLTVAVECDKKCRDLFQASGSCETSLVDTSDPDVFTELPATAGRQLLGRAPPPPPPTAAPTPCIRSIASSTSSTAGRQLLGRAPPSPTGAPTAAPTACSTSSGSSGSSGSSTSSTAGCVHPAATYLASLIAGTSSIYSRDLGVSLQVKYMKVWSGTSPFDAGTNSLNDLVSAYSSVTGTKKDADIAHLFTGIVEGGLAYVGTACDNNGYNTGVSSIRGNWGGSLNANAYNWDLIVTSHELGHNVGSGHTHSYNPPIDQCVVGGSAVSRSSSNCVRGTIMSYCHLCGGIANVDMKLDPRVITKIKTNLGSSSGRCKLSGI